MTQLEKIQQEISQLPPEDIVNLDQWFTEFQKVALKKPMHKQETYHDLDFLIGTWSEAQAKEFEEATADFGQIDEALWM